MYGAGIFDNFSSKFLFKSVGRRQSAAFARILVAKYFCPLAMATKMVAAWNAVKVTSTVFSYLIRFMSKDVNCIGGWELC